MLGFELDSYPELTATVRQKLKKTADAFDGLFGFTKKVGNSPYLQEPLLKAMNVQGTWLQGSYRRCYKLCSKS